MALTDNEIIKALECCVLSECENCPHDEETACKENLNQEILDLINRLQAEKEALIAGQETLQKALAEKIAEIERLKEEVKKEQLYNLRMTAHSVKAEAVKDVLKKVKTYCYENVWFETNFEEQKLYQYLDNLEKEKAGEG